MLGLGKSCGGTGNDIVGSHRYHPKYVRYNKRSQRNHLGLLFGKVLLSLGCHVAFCDWMVLQIMVDFLREV